MHARPDKLTAKELYVISARFGVGDRESGGLSNSFLMSDEEMSRIEEEALRKLRHMTMESFQVLRKAV